MSNHVPETAARAWDSRLRHAGLRGDHDGIVTGDSAAFAERGLMTPLLDRGWLQISGADAVSFLNAQLAADVPASAETPWKPAAYCSPKGRVLAIPDVLNDGDGFRIVLPADLLEAIRDRLKLFVLQSRVQIDTLPDHGAIGLWGDAAGGALSGAGLAPPADNGGAHHQEGIVIIRLPDPVPRYLIAGTHDRLFNVWDRLAAAVQPAATNAWRLREIETGRPDIVAAHSERYLPQSLNLEAWGALSFDKGCFPGQEVVARLHYLGRAKQHLYRAGVAGHAPAPGDTVTGAGSKSMGTIVSAAEAGNGSARVLAVLRDAPGGDFALENGNRLEQIERLVG